MTDNARRPADLALGIDQPITRRDFLGSTLLASGAQLLEPFAPAHFLAAHPEQSLPGAAEDWNGYGGVGDYANSNGNTWEVLSAGHRLRGTPNAPDLSSSHLLLHSFFSGKLPPTPASSSSKITQSSAAKPSKTNSKWMAAG